MRFELCGDQTCESWLGKASRMDVLCVLAGDTSSRIIFFSMITSLAASGEEPRRDLCRDRDRAVGGLRTDNASHSLTERGASERDLWLMVSTSLISLTSLMISVSGGASSKRVVVASIVSTVSPVKPNDLLSRAKYSLDNPNTWSMFSGPRAFSMRMVFSSYIWLVTNI